MADVFNDDNTNNEVDVTLEDLVGDGRKYSEPNQLAKAYANSETFIEQLKRENAELRAAQDAAAIRNNQKQQPPANEPDPNADKQQVPPKQAPSDDDFRSQIRDTVKRLNEEERGLANLDTAAAKLVELHGSEAKANEALKNRARELDVSVDWLKETAMRSPQAFYNTMGLAAPGNRQTPAPSSDVRLNDSGNVRNFEYYDKIRKENKNLYWSREMQLEMQNAAKQAGPDFYKR